MVRGEAIKAGWATWARRPRRHCTANSSSIRPKGERSGQAAALGQIGADARSAAPFLEELLNTGNDWEAGVGCCGVVEDRPAIRDRVACNQAIDRARGLAGAKTLP